MSTGFYHNAVIKQDRDFFPQLVLRLGVRDRNLGAPGLQKQSRGHAGFAQPDDENAFVGEIHKGGCWLLAAGFWLTSFWKAFGLWLESRSQELEALS